MTLFQHSHKKGEFNLTRRLTAFLAIIFLFLLVEIADAGIQVNPFIVEVLVTPGEVYEGVFQVNNTSGNPADISVQPEQWAAESVDFHEWLEIDPIEFTLEGNGVTKVKFKINPPKEATGELMCMVFFIYREKGEKASPVGVKFGSPIYAIIKGSGNIDVSIDDIKIKYDKEKRVASGVILINNKSNVHIRPIVTITFLDEEGMIAAGFELPYRQPAQREQVRTFEFNEKIFLRSGKYKAVVKADCGKLYSIDKVFEKDTELVVEDVVKENTEQETLPRRESAEETEVQK